MDDPWSGRATNRRPAAATAQERVDKSPRVMARRRMDDHAGRLVDDSEVFVLVHHLERNRFGGSLGNIGLRDLELDHVTRCHSIRGIGGSAVDQNEMSPDQACCSRAAEIGSLLREEAVEPWRRGRRDQAVSGLRSTYPASRATTPMVMAESATLNTGQK